MQVFCEQYRISVSVLNNWRGQLGMPDKQSRRKSFIQLNPVQQPLVSYNQPFAELISISGIRAILRQVVGVDFLKVILTEN